MENPIRIRIQAKEPAGHVPLVGRHDGVLGNILDLAGLGVRVWYSRIQIVLARPLGGGGEGFDWVGAKKVEGMCGLVEVDVDVVDGAAKHGDIATPVVGPIEVGWEANNVTDVLPSTNRQAAEGVDQINEGTRAVSMIANDPRGRALPSSLTFLPSGDRRLKDLGLTSLYLTVQVWISAALNPSPSAILLQSDGIEPAWKAVWVLGVIWRLLMNPWTRLSRSG